MRLANIQAFLREKGMPFRYFEENDCGTVEFDHRGLHYHIWEYPAPERGAECNLISAGRSMDYDGDYEAKILEILRTWQQ